MAAAHVSPFGGSWYPGSPGPLEQLLEDLFARSVQRTGPHLLSRAAGFVVPHAGLIYSGTVAAAAYRHLREQKPQRIVILGFSHRGGPDGVAIPDVHRITTPLGEVTVDRRAVEQLASRSPFRRIQEDRVCDHSVEIQLPLLQKAAPGATVVPLYVGRLGQRELDLAAERLAGMAAPDTGFLISSDLTHYGEAFYYEPFPPDQHVAERLRDLDFSVIDSAGTLDAAVFHDTLAHTGATVCGSAPIGLWLRTLGHIADEIFQQTLDYQTSGEITGDFCRCVSYAALGYFPASAFELSPEDRLLLLESARSTLEHLRHTGQAQAIPPKAITPALTWRTGVFVSLHRGLELLGCVGDRAARMPLAEAVPELTLSAGLDDPRFPSVLGVQGEIDIEISVLSPLKRIRDAASFRLHQHGAYLELGARNAILLPQVARNRNWTQEQFLGALAHKAGLMSKAWEEPDARLYVFRAQVFSQQGGAVLDARPDLG